MIYKGQFTSRDNIRYTIKVDNHLVDGSTVEQDIELSNPPFTTTLEGDDNDIYKPLKMSMGTLGLVSSDYIFELYSPKPQDVKVTLTAENEKYNCNILSPYGIAYSENHIVGSKLEPKWTFMLWGKRIYLKAGAKIKVSGIYGGRFFYGGQYRAYTLTDMNDIILSIAEQDVSYTKNNPLVLDITQDSVLYLNSHNYDDEFSVTIENQENIKWCGFVTPSIYSQDFGDNDKIINVDCLDEISTLQYIKWGSWDNTLIADPQVLSFYDILKIVCNKFTSIKYIHFPHILKDASDNSIITLKTLSVNTRAFIDEEDPKETFSVLDVLSEMANILNMSMSQEGEHLYFVRVPISYECYKYDITTDSLTYEPDIVSYPVIEKWYAGSNVSLTECLSQVVVSTDVKHYNEIFGDIFDDSNFTNYTSGSNGEWGYFIEDDIKDEMKLKTRLLKHKNNPCKAYLGINKNPVNYDIITYYQMIGGYNWAGFIDYTEIPDYSQQEYWFKSHSTNNYTRYLVLNWYNKYWNEWDYRTATTPLFTIKSKEKYYITDNMMMRLNIAGRHQPRRGAMLIRSGGGDDADKLQPVHNKLVGRLKIGNYYLFNELPDNRVPHWVDYESNFIIQYNGFGYDGSMPMLGRVYNSKFSIIDTSGDHMDLDWESGYLIPPPPNDAIEEPVEIEFSIMSTGVETHEKVEGGTNWWWMTEYISELTLDLVTGTDNTLKKEDIDTDTSYERVIDDDYVENEKDITVKICTYDGKEPNYNSLFNNKKYLDRVIDLTNSTTMAVRLEEHKIYRYVHQYEKPLRKATLLYSYKPSVMSYVTTDTDVTGLNVYSAIVNGYTIDYYDNKNNTVNLVEFAS